ncbi:MAG: hypoxanthine phosphoribosyltransferase [Acholeplasmatales bacterium]|jgi:hypoxanthine phosphoribosyltransferase|nr:hypoxanthine phosphoribosyltransferase [Acholeplasmatales bacterium]
MEKFISRVLFSKRKINRIVKKLANKITADYKDKNPVLVGMLKGCNPFISDLVKKLDFPLEISYMIASSYKGTTSTGSVDIKLETDISLEGRNVIIIEDIIDTGTTLSNIKKILSKSRPLSVELCTLLDKPSKRITTVDVKYIGAYINDYFVIGYGLDYNQKYRNLPYIGIISPEYI